MTVSRGRPGLFVTDSATPPVAVHCLDCGATLRREARRATDARRHCSPCLAVTRERVRADMAGRKHCGIVGWGLDDRPLGGGLSAALTDAPPDIGAMVREGRSVRAVALALGIGLGAAHRRVTEYRRAHGMPHRAPGRPRKEAA